MLKRLIAAAMALVMCISALPALADQSVNARISLSGASSAQRTNISLAAEAIDGVSIPYGESFSFNTVVGPRTKAYGFVSALNGRGAKVTGGGVAQTASALYLALKKLDAGVNIDELHTYGSRYNQSYVSSGSDAVMVDYSSGSDFVFTNFNDDMHIQMWMTDSYLYCTLTLSEEESGQDDSFLDWGDDWTSSGDWDSGDWETDWDGGWNSGRVKIASSSIELNGTDSLINNVTLAAASINDTVLPSGAVFSFNDIVGPRGERYGYEAAVNGRGSRVIGGGVAQVASAVWIAVKNLDCVSIVEKSTYGKKYNQSYVASSSDAILTDYGAGTDFSFRNSGDSQLTISTYISGGTLYCDIYEN